MGLCSGTGARFGEAYSLFQARCEGREGRLEGGKKEKLLKVGLELKVLRMENYGFGNMLYWRVVVDDERGAFDGGIREAVRRGLVTEVNHWDWWSLSKRENGDVYDENSIYGEHNVVREDG